jgi:hypothetical protein
MVFYFQPRGFDPSTKDYLIYMGKDKYENEELLRHAIPLDVWYEAFPDITISRLLVVRRLFLCSSWMLIVLHRFHVDDLSSAHVYLRLPPGKTYQEIPSEALEDCCQLVKANSIQGNKVDNLSIVYTPVNNLKKTATMEVGQVGPSHIVSTLKRLVGSSWIEICSKLVCTAR